MLSVTNIPRSGDGMSALKRDFGHVAGYLLHPLLKEGLNLPGSPPPQLSARDELLANGTRH